MISATTHLICRKTIDNNDASPYASVRFANRCPPKIDNKCLRSMVADYISKNENLKHLVLERDTNGENIKVYCDKIKKGNIQDDELEFRVLAMLCHLCICVFLIKKTSEGKININVLKYGEQVEIFIECIYILYDEEHKHYEPLYAINKQNPDENITIFKRNDETVIQLIYKFIQELYYDVNTPSDCNNLAHVNEQPTESNVLNENDSISDLITPRASTNLYNKRKTPHYDNFLRIPTIKEVPSSMSDRTYASNKRTKSFELDNPDKSLSDKNNSELLTIEEYLQMNININLSEALNDELEIDKMRFENEPALKFRGRTSRDFKPKKATKRNGKPSEPRPPRYFQDCSHHRYLSLLIPEAYFSPDIIEYCFEICIVTPEINGYTYINSYFNFQVHPTDSQSPNLNPIYKFFNNINEFKRYSETLRQLKLQLVVVMHTNKELLQSDQPLQIFSSPKNTDHGNTITTKFNDHKTFKNAYHLHDLRFAVTLWTKKSGEKVFRRHDDKQCISQISTEDKNTKVRNKNQTV
ncbi:unnamed protein product [Rotaria sp. Silwood1]|nr:unnamed protein product [Rotaria sp. Silwood1]